ncbi:WxL domain-containing protein [Companilactobacillus mishanensis]|uniref:WxL domain-containing protein n=1 Tax=Companilactobacillus mishanensis TaxID=2486008 RepID=A0A5P0ZKH6_9LACO|nr:WxL domain-containing protein [Companilactobacillus mishanensis]MQS53574.1 WxL domain-containing protein [Companilactobacillus mishanensis]
MKKLIKVTTLLGAAVLGLSTAGVGVVNAASFTPGVGSDEDTVSGTTTAKVGLEQDPDNNKITLNSAPDIDFGVLKIGKAISGQEATTVSDTVKVSNPGIDSGWSVLVQTGSFDGTATAGGAATLKGVVLHFTPGTVTADSENAGDLPIGTKVDSNGEAQPILGAVAGTGIGDFTQKHETSDVTIDIPQGNVAGTYQANLTWTLSNAPS